MLFNDKMTKQKQQLKKQRAEEIKAIAPLLLIFRKIITSIEGAFAL